MILEQSSKVHQRPGEVHDSILVVADKNCCHEKETYGESISYHGCYNKFPTINSDKT